MRTVGSVREAAQLRLRGIVTARKVEEGDLVENLKIILPRLVLNTFS